MSNPEKIPFLEGRPDRKKIIQGDDISNIIIELNIQKDSYSFLKSIGYDAKPVTDYEKERADFFNLARELHEDSNKIYKTDRNDPRLS